MTIEEMRNRKTQLGLTNEMISELSGIPLSTIQKIMSGATKAPRRVTLEAIETVLYAEELRRHRSVKRENSIFCSGNVQTPMKGNVKYTYPPATSDWIVTTAQWYSRISL